MNRSELIIPSSKEIFKRLNFTTRIRLFEPGNEKRDINLLLRRDVVVMRPVDLGLFACPHCGGIGFSRPWQMGREGSDEVEYFCSACGSKDILWVEGIWRGTMARPNLDGASCDKNDDYGLGYRIHRLNPENKNR